MKHRSKRVPPVRKTDIYPIVIATPHGVVTLAYRMEPGGENSNPFLYSVDLLSPGSRKPMADFLLGFDIVDGLSAAWWSLLTEKERHQVDQFQVAE